MDKNTHMDSIDDVPIILRREIEALMVAPFLQAFAAELGNAKTTKIAAKVIAELANKAGKDMAKVCGGNTLALFHKTLPLFSQGGALEMETKERSDTCLKFNITKCAYAEMYRENGLSDIGSLLSCQRDVHLFKGYNPDFAFTRTQTIMEGGSYCDFCLKLNQEEP